MLFRLIGLAMCGAAGLWANVCQGLADAPADGSDVPETTRSLALRLAVKADGPAFRITIRSSGGGHSGDIEVARCEDGKRVQVLELMTRQSIDFARVFHARDVNFDGYLDFAVLVESAGTWGSERWWVYDPAAGRFVENELTRELRALKAADYSIDAKKQEIGTRYLTEPWGCGSTGDRYRVVNSRLLLVHSEVAKPANCKAAPCGCSVVVSDRVGGAMRVSAVREFLDGKLVK
jgi:hypothetical protein